MNKYTRGNQAKEELKQISQDVQSIEARDKFPDESV